jgi:serine phosphatase RsbU (regulator of sigma subunit)
MVLLNTAGMPLGIEAEQRYRHDTVPLHEQDVLCLYTDGLSAMFEQNGTVAGVDYLHNLIRLRLYASPAQIVDGILEEYDRMPGRAQLSDDYTLLVLKLKSPA